jgi:nicotinamide mononucleotide transporter PnuC
MAAAFVVPIACALIWRSAFLAAAASILGLVVAVLLAKAKIEGRFLSLISIPVYAFVAFQSGLYGEMIYAMAFLYPLNAFAIYEWIRNQRVDVKKGRVTVVRKTSAAEVAAVVLSQAVLGVGYFFMLRAFGTQLLILSSITMAGGVSAAYFAARREGPISQIFWILDEILLAALWLLLFDPSVAPLIVFGVLSVVIDVYGLFLWRRLQFRQKVSGGSDSLHTSRGR